MAGRVIKIAQQSVRIAVLAIGDVNLARQLSKRDLRVAHISKSFIVFLLWWMQAMTLERDCRKSLATYVCMVVLGTLRRHTR